MILIPASVCVTISEQKDSSLWMVRIVASDLSKGIGSNKEVLPKYLVETIDKAVNQDFFIVRSLSPEDRENEMYKAIQFAFEAARTDVVYERVVISDKAPVIPEKQFLFGFRPTGANFCIFTQKSSHKKMLCDSPVRELAKTCILTQSLQYVLLEADSFKVWGYIPVCCSDHDHCPNKARPVGMRRELY